MIGATEIYLICDADIYLGDTIIGEAAGSWSRKSFKITIEGDQVAVGSRNVLTFGADSYCVEISAGVDSAFIAMIVMALDELYHTI